MTPSPHSKAVVGLSGKPGGFSVRSLRALLVSAWFSLWVLQRPPLKFKLMHMRQTGHSTAAIVRESEAVFPLPLELRKTEILQQITGKWETAFKK